MLQDLIRWIGNESSLEIKRCPSDSPLVPYIERSELDQVRGSMSRKMLVAVVAMQ